MRVGEGLYVLRYLASLKPKTAPSAIVRLADGEAGDIDIIVAPGLGAGEMLGPGSNIVLVARKAGLVEVVLKSSSGQAPPDARFSLDLLAPAVPRTYLAAARSGSDMPATQRSSVKGGFGKRPTLDILAHVARRGDISADSDGWVAGPKSPSAIEGLELRCEGADIGISMQYKNAASVDRWSAWQAPGKFAGTRQKASPITGLRLKLVGTESASFELEGEALFLGSTILTGRGDEIEFVSAGGSDPLVGLRLALVELPPVRDPQIERLLPRVRVFRSYAE